MNRASSALTTFSACRLTRRVVRLIICPYEFHDLPADPQQADWVAQMLAGLEGFRAESVDPFLDEEEFKASVSIIVRRRPRSTPGRRNPMEISGKIKSVVETSRDSYGIGIKWARPAVFP